MTVPLPPAPPAEPTELDDLDDEALDRVDLALEPATEADAAAQAPYRRMLTRLRELPPVEPPAGWEARAEARLRAARAAERRRMLVGVGLPTVAAAAVVAVMLLRSSPTPDRRELEVAVVAPEGVVRRGPAAIGDRLRVVAPPARGEVELRVYRGDRLVARCPSTEPGARCERSGARGDLALVLELREAGVYRSVSLTAGGPLPAPGEDGLDADLLRARRAGAVVERAEPVHVR